jgi:hypothetical protein
MAFSNLTWPVRILLYLRIIQIHLTSDNEVTETAVHLVLTLSPIEPVRLTVTSETFIFHTRINNGGATNNTSPSAGCVPAANRV